MNGHTDECSRAMYRGPHVCICGRDRRAVAESEQSDRIPRTLERIRDLQPQAVGYIRRYGFVMDKVGPITDDTDEVTRWKVLAFSLYTDLVEASTIAEKLIGASAAPPKPLIASEPMESVESGQSDRPSHFVSCYRLRGQCCSGCHEEEDEGYTNLYIENADVGPSTFVGVRSCCRMSDKVEERVVRMTARLGGSGRRW